VWGGGDVVSAMLTGPGEGEGVLKTSPGAQVAELAGGPDAFAEGAL